MWYGENEDPFMHVGYARLIVVRHVPGYNLYGRKDNCIHIVNTETFAIGFVCPEISKSRWGRETPSVGWLDDEVSGSEHKINHLFKNKKCGIYELTGEIWHWSSQSYEGEWDGDSELRKTAIREIEFDHAMYFDCEAIRCELVHLIPKNPEPAEDYFNREGDIHHYMTKVQILKNHAMALARIIENRYVNSHDYRESKVEDLENTIHMMMLQIDSEAHLEKYRQLTLEIDEKVQRVLKEHRDLMVEDE